MNEDYISGMRLLLKKSKEQGLDIIRKCQWIPNVSKMLSEYNLCYKFWRNTCNQNRIKNILKCNSWYDLLYNINVCAFLWIMSNESPAFWREKFWIILGLDIDGDPIDCATKLSNMKL